MYLMELNYYALCGVGRGASENQLLRIMWGGVRMNILKKIKKLIPMQLSQIYNNDCI